MKKIAHCIHHTHWDLIWYFTEQDAAVQLCYNVKEMLEGFRTGRIEHFFFDGQTYPIAEYLDLHPEDEAFVKELVTSGKLVVGPFQSQLDCFICSGESVVNNLRLGMKKAAELGRVSKIAYLPDSFGHSRDFPKIFNSFGIRDFVITRGVGDEYGLGSEFYLESDDGSRVLTCTMIAGYGYGCYPFKNGTLFEEGAEDYNKISVRSLIDRLLSYSTLENEFVFPLGFDQNPAMLDIPARIRAYNDSQDDIEFVETTWEDFCRRVREQGVGLKTHRGELFSTQYHRVHRSIFSARADIKALQDRCERALTFELQPLMAMLDSLGVPYDHGLIDRAWDTLLACQTHSSATLTDETNAYVERETRNALNLATSNVCYLMKLVSLSLEEAEGRESAMARTSPLIVFNTLPGDRSCVVRAKVLTASPSFSIEDHGRPLAFSVVKQQKKNCGVLRRDPELTDRNKFYYETDVLLACEGVPGIGYVTLDVHEAPAPMGCVARYDRAIENESYRVFLCETGVSVVDKRTGVRLDHAIYLEESGDEGDSFDYSWPTRDLVLTTGFEDAVAVGHVCAQAQWLELTGSMRVPSGLDARARGERDELLGYHVTISLVAGEDIVRIEGSINNRSRAHRVRLVVRGDEPQTVSLAGTQYGVIERETVSPDLDRWRQDGWFEEPSATWPLLNHVSRCERGRVTTVYTTSVKEYEFVGDGCSDIAVTLFRSYGAMGYPDLNRRPGRPSGLDYMVFETPGCQMMGENRFSVAVRLSDSFDACEVANDYTLYACAPLTFQRQEFDKSIDPITYFPTNPLPQKLPRSYRFLTLMGTPAAFGSVVASDAGDGYVLRLFNPSGHETEGGHIESVSQNLYLTNLEGGERAAVARDLPRMRAGELRIISLE